MNMNYILISCLVLYLSTGGEGMARAFDIPEPAPSSCGLAKGGFSVSGEFPDVDLANVSFCYYMKGWMTLIRKNPTGYTASYRMM